MSCYCDATDYGESATRTRALITSTTVYSMHTYNKTGSTTLSSCIPFLAQLWNWKLWRAFFLCSVSFCLSVFCCLMNDGWMEIHIIE
ncbi:hypothetical protein BDZ91DRAFT_481816 [Kalaharituber pfeilii]|nr:hypothetical protein BDZ91DRAFT_481816 [Kalaharituber pfeilii]